jgi:hypothetical protein
MTPAAREARRKVEHESETLVLRRWLVMGETQLGGRRVLYALLISLASDPPLRKQVDRVTHRAPGDSTNLGD